MTTATVRDCLYSILKQECADGIINDMGLDWCIVTALAMTQTASFKPTPESRAFVKWHHEQWLAENEAEGAPT